MLNHSKIYFVIEQWHLRTGIGISGQNVTVQSAWNFPRPVTNIRPLLEVGLEHTLSLADCLAGSGIDAGLLDQPGAVIQAEQELRVVCNLLHHIGHDQALGVLAGSRHHLTSHGIFGLAVLSSPTFLSATRLGMRYLQATLSYCRISPEAMGDEACLIVDGEDLPEDVRDFLIERDIAALVTSMADLDAINLPVKAIRLRQTGGRAASHFQALFSIMPEQGQAANMLVVEACRLEQRLPQSNPMTLRLCQEECARLLDQYRRRGGLAGRVRERLAGSPAAIPGMDVVARELNMHVRTLRRHLAAEGVDYASLVEEVRGALAEELLKGTDLRIEEIAERLSYSESSTFIRAFKRWSGKSPQRYRQELRANLETTRPVR